MAVITEKDTLTITNAAPSITAGAFFKYPEDPFKEIIFNIEDATTEMDPITGPFEVVVWGRYPTSQKWRVVDEWLLEDVAGPVAQPITFTLGFDYFYVQAKNAGDSGDYKVFMAYEPGSGVK